MPPTREVTKQSSSIFLSTPVLRQDWQRPAVGFVYSKDDMVRRKEFFVPIRECFVHSKEFLVQRKKCFVQRSVFCLQQRVIWSKQGRRKEVPATSSHSRPTPFSLAGGRRQEAAARSQEAGGRRQEHARLGHVVAGRVTGGQTGIWLYCIDISETV